VAAPLFPDDAISRLIRRLVRWGGWLEPHHHHGIHASLSEILALADLSTARGLTQAELGERLALEKSTVSRLVTGLERQALLTRERDPANRRFVRLQLTEAGQQAAERIGAHFRDQHERLLRLLTPAEAEALGYGLTALARVIDELAAPVSPGETPAQPPAAG
jgi:DNA-binding MarR family transcriptional regulator